MVGIAVGPDSTVVHIFGRGISVPVDFELAPGVFLTGDKPQHHPDQAARGSYYFEDYAAVIYGKELATFSLRVDDSDAPGTLGSRAWNALWIFHLLSLACRTPCLSLYAVSDGAQPLFKVTTPSPIARPLTAVHAATLAELDWARQHGSEFDRLVELPEFSAAMRCYGNAHLLPEYDVRLMLLWAGIEGLLSVDGELNRRLALYSAILFDGSTDEKAAHFDFVKKAYGVRSKAVHGSGLKPAKLRDGCEDAGKILTTLLRKCVEIGRVPAPAELDRVAVSGGIS